jgi:shikimate kinase
MNSRTGKKQRPLIFLVGFMGVGKSSVGERLAERLGWSFVDLDREIEHAAGSTIAEIFQNRGEPHFRKLEREQLERVVVRIRTVVALGGGAFCDPENQKLLSPRGTAVWLDAPIASIHARIDSCSRPLAGNRGEMERLHDRRRPYYQKADLHIKVRSQTVDELATEILKQLEF